MSSDDHQNDKPIETLSYAAVQERRSHGITILTVVIVGITALTLYSAIRYPGAYESSIVSRCGTPAATVERFIWLTGVPALVLSVVGWRASRRPGRHRAYRFITARCVWINVAALAAPWVWGFLDRIRLFG